MNYSLSNTRGSLLLELAIANIIGALGALALTMGFLSLHKFQSRLEGKMDLQIRLQQTAFHLANVVRLAEDCSLNPSHPRIDCTIIGNGGETHVLSYRFERDIRNPDTKIRSGTLTLFRDGVEGQKLYLSDSNLCTEPGCPGNTVWLPQQFRLSSLASDGEQVTINIAVRPRTGFYCVNGAFQKWPVRYRWQPLGGKR